MECSPLPAIVARLTESIQAFSPTIESLRAYWAPDNPSAMAYMMALGEAFMQGGAPMDEYAALVFDRVEAILADGTDPDRTLISTGFLEEVVSAIDRTPELASVLVHIGPLAMEYIEAWNEFMGVRNWPPKP